MKRKGVFYEITIIVVLIILVGILLMVLNPVFTHIYNWQTTVNATDLSNGVLYSYYIWHYLPFLILLGFIGWIIIKVQRKNEVGGY